MQSFYVYEYNVKMPKSLKIEIKSAGRHNARTPNDAIEHENYFCIYNFYIRATLLCYSIVVRGGSSLWHNLYCMHTHTHRHTHTCTRIHILVGWWTSLWWFHARLCSAASANRRKTRSPNDPTHTHFDESTCENTSTTLWRGRGELKNFEWKWILKNTYA